MIVDKESTVDDICNFIKQFTKNAKIISKFKEERIKGNEIFYLEKEDFLYLGFKLYNKMLSKLDEIKNNNKDILIYNEVINDNYTEKQIYHFLKNEMKFDEEILTKFKNINGEKFKKLKKNNLNIFGLKIGDVKKFCKFIDSLKSTEEINITNSSTPEEVCTFLKNKFQLDEEVLENIKSNEIDGNTFLEFTEDDIEDLNINN